MNQWMQIICNCEEIKILIITDHDNMDDSDCDNNDYMDGS